MASFQTKKSNMESAKTSEKCAQTINEKAKPQNASMNRPKQGKSSNVGEKTKTLEIKKIVKVMNLMIKMTQ